MYIAAAQRLTETIVRKYSSDTKYAKMLMSARISCICFGHTEYKAPVKPQRKYEKNYLFGDYFSADLW